MKQKKSTIDEDQKGLFLVDKCGQDRIVAIATGPIFTKGDPKMTADKTYHIDVPAAAGMAGNQVNGLHKQQNRNGPSNGKELHQQTIHMQSGLVGVQIVSTVFSKPRLKKNEEMNFTDCNQEPKAPDNGLGTK